MRAGDSVDLGLGISLSSPLAGVLAEHWDELEGFVSVHKKTQANVFVGKGRLASSVITPCLLPSILIPCI